MKKDGLSLILIMGLLSGTSGLNAQLIYKDISLQSGIRSGGENIGVAFGDYDNDGDEDLYVSVRNSPNKLFQNLDGHTFVNVAKAAGVDYDGNSRTSIWLDINNDGLLDLYVGNFDELDRLYLNKGDGTFEDLTRWARIYNPGRTFSVNAADVNQDGLIDIYVANFREENKLFINQGNNIFSNQIEAAGAKSTFNAMGAVFFDYDNDNDSDLYLTHDGQPYLLYKNIGGGVFREVSEEVGVHYDGFGMGVDVADVNQDGFLDMYITNLYENVLFINKGDGTFEDRSATAQVQDYGMGWGTNFLDFNNDGLPDIYVTNDSYFSDYANVLYKNIGNASFRAMPAEYEAASKMAGYGSAVADVNRDGFVDLAVANAGRNDYLQLFANQNRQGNWIGFKLEGVKSNRAAIGARVEIIDDEGMLHVDEVNAGSGYASMNSLVLHFGLGQAENVQSGRIIWPSGQRQELESLQGGFYYKIIEGAPPVLLQSTLTNTEEEKLNFLNLSIFPNPAGDFFNLSFQLREAGYLHVWLYDMEGKKVMERLNYEGMAGENSIPIDHSLPRGTYQLVYASEDFFGSERLIIK